MSELRPWLDERHPPAPPELRAAVDRAVDHSGGSGADEDPLIALTHGTRRCLDGALARPGRVRESAFALLTADALLTYACEAALDEGDPDEALRSLVPGLLEATGAR